ncbi:MAG: hypothetical protein IPJ94_17360 [Chloroflexi bacterium]|nr:hypothetical protein [Chloroflexota bacterium]
MDRTRLIFVGIVGVALVIVTAVFFLNGGVDGRTVAVTGLVGSEKVLFFEDERVLAALHRNGPRRQRAKGRLAGNRHQL